MWPFKRKDPPTPALDPAALLVPMRTAVVGMNGYTALDRYRDFRAVFINGNADAACSERVAFQLFALTGLHQTCAGVDVHDTYRKVGRQEVGLELLRWIMMEPPGHQPERTER